MVFGNVFPGLCTPLVEILSGYTTQRSDERIKRYISNSNRKQDRLDEIKEVQLNIRLTLILLPDVKTIYRNGKPVDSIATTVT